MAAWNDDRRVVKGRRHRTCGDELGRVLGNTELAPRCGGIWQSGTVQPPPDASGTPLHPCDAFDVPVWVRRSSPLKAQGPHPSRLGLAVQPWPAPEKVPADGRYRVSTTWRDVIDAALSVGRELTPWLEANPALARSEIIARIAPLVAYLRRQTHTGGTGFRVEPNVVYRFGTESSARGAFGYRIGMTMAEWACRGLMGCGPTIHAEADRPQDAGPAWKASRSRPDLVAKHPAGPTTWLIEAKGRRNLDLDALRKGVDQLSTPGLLTGDHVRVLCGTGLDPQLFMTIDVEEHISERRSLRQRAGAYLADDDDLLLAVARSRMPLYLALTAIPATERQIVPVGLTIPEVADRSRGGTVTLLEADPETQQERAEAAGDTERYEGRDGRERRDMLTGRVPGTDLTIGMSRRLYRACRSLADFQWATAEQGDPDLHPWAGAASNRMAIDPFDAPDSWSEALYWQGGLARRAVERTRGGFKIGERSTWSDLLDGQTIPFRLTTPNNLLEAATADTYLAIERRTVI